MFGDNALEYLAPCIYEGEGEMLGMAFFKSLVKHHGTTYFESIGKALQAAGIKKPNPLNPAHMWALKGAIGPYASWLMGQYASPKPSPSLPPMPAKLSKHAEYAAQELQRRPTEISGVMRKHQLKLVDRQCRRRRLTSYEKDEGKFSLDLYVTKRTIDQQDVLVYGVRHHDYGGSTMGSINKEYTTMAGLIEYCLAPTLKGIKL